MIQPKIFEAGEVYLLYIGAFGLLSVSPIPVPLDGRFVPNFRYNVLGEGDPSGPNKLSPYLV